MSLQTAPVVHSSSAGFGFLNNFRIGPKIIAGYLLLILLMIGVASTAYWGMTHIAEADHLALQHQSDIANLWAMQFYLHEQYIEQSNLIYNNDSSRIEAYRANIENMDMYKELVRASLDLAEETQWLADIDRLDAQNDALFHEQIVPAWEAKDEALLKKLDAQSDELIMQMQSISERLITSFQKGVVDTQRAADETYNQTLLMMLVVSAGAALAGLAFGYFLSRAISRPVQIITAATARLAQGDLNQELAITGRDEIGQMAEAFRQMIFNLRDLIGQVMDTANTVGVASGQLSTAAEQAGQATQQVAATIQQIAQGTTQQTQSVTEAANNVTQIARASEGIARGAQEQAQGITKTSDLTLNMAAIVTQVGQCAHSVSEANAKVTQAARSGVSTVGQTNQGMDAIRTRTLTAADKIKEMGHRSKEIGRIVETIDDIADKTDMLALNAAVEAARAGEYGRGFAVVADQVRKLSEDSKAATRDIGDLIERVQETIHEAITAMDNTTLEVDNGVRLTSDTTRSLGEILQAAENAASLAEQITTAVNQLKQKSEGVVAAMETVTAVVEENTAVAEEMAASSQEVTQAMEGVAGVAEENSAAAEEVSASAEEMSAQVEEVVASAQELSELAEQLRAAVAQFQLEESGPPQHHQPTSTSTRQPKQPKLELVLVGHHSNGHKN